jgi:hypothetical protein
MSGKYLDLPDAPFLEDEPAQGRKDDTGKLPLHLVPVALIASAARAFGYGADKYGVDNWRIGFVRSRLFAALLRHLYAWWNGEDRDSESGLEHLDHAAATLGMLTGNIADGTGLDDRPAVCEPREDELWKILDEDAWSTASGVDFCKECNALEGTKHKHSCMIGRLYDALKGK